MLLLLSQNVNIQNYYTVDERNILASLYIYSYGFIAYNNHYYTRFNIINRTNAQITFLHIRSFAF